MRVLELMKTHIVKAEPEMTMREAVDMMDLYQVSGLPVVNRDGALLGVVTEFDAIRELLPRFASFSGEGGADATITMREQAEEAGKRLVSDCMTSPAIAIDENADVGEAARLMHDRHIKRLPVTSGGLVVGIISRVDICQALLEGEIFKHSIDWETLV